MTRTVTSQDVFAAAVPPNVDPNDPNQFEHIQTELNKLVEKYVWQQFNAEQPEQINLTHVEWVITNQPADVDGFQPDDCAACRAGNDQATAFLRDNPGRYIALANLTYDEIWAQ